MWGKRSVWVLGEFGLPQRHGEHKGFYSGSEWGEHRLRLVPSYAKEFTEEPPDSI